MAILKSELTCSSHQLLFRLFLIDLYTSLLFSTEAQLKPVIQSALHHQLGVYPGCREPCHGQGASSGPQAGKSRSKRSQTNVAHRTTQSFPCNTPIPRRACTFAASRSGPPGLAWPPLTPGFGEMPIICWMTEHGPRVFPLSLNSAAGKSPRTWYIPTWKQGSPARHPDRCTDSLFQGSSAGANRKVRTNNLLIIKAESKPSWLCHLAKKTASEGPRMPATLLYRADHSIFSPLIQLMCQSVPVLTHIRVFHTLAGQITSEQASEWLRFIWERSYSF